MTVVATAGHVDHGKSSLVLALTGTDPDRFEEEKRRGLTIDLGFAHSTLPSGATVSFVDVPGHARFVHNMLAGVGGVAGCLFVVAATEGWKPQSEEHLRILEMFGVTAGVIALTKVDLVDADLLAFAEMEIIDHVAGSFLETATVVPVSTVTGSGIDDLRGALDTLVTSVPAALDRGRPRLWIDRVFAAKGSGTVVTGTLLDGTVVVDQNLVVEPSRVRARVRAIQRAGEPVASSGPGERVALNLAGVDRDALGRGGVLVESGHWYVSDAVDASLTVLDALDHRVSRRGSYLAYIGSGEHAVALRVLGEDDLAPGSTGAVRLFLPTALPLLPGDRYILRESGRDETVGGGEVLDVAPVTKASKAAPDRSIERVVRERVWITASELELLTGVAVEAVVGEWVTTDEALRSVGDAIAVRVEAAGPLGLEMATLDDRERAVAATLEQFVVAAGRIRVRDAADPLAHHPYLDELAGQLLSPPPPDHVDRHELRELIRRGDVVQCGGVCFHRDAIDEAARVVSTLVSEHPDGFSVAQFRDATGATRKYSLPLVEELDARGITRRRGDLRIAGPRLAN